MIVSDVAWVRDHQHRLVLRLRLDGHLADIPSGQRVELTRRGLVKGVDVPASERRRDLAARSDRPDTPSTISPSRL